MCWPLKYFIYGEVGCFRRSHTTPNYRPIPRLCLIATYESNCAAVSICHCSVSSHRREMWMPTTAKREKIVNTWKAQIMSYTEVQRSVCTTYSWWKRNFWNCNCPTKTQVDVQLFMYERVRKCRWFFSWWIGFYFWNTNTKI